VHNPYALAPHAVEFSDTIIKGLPFPSRQVRIRSNVPLRSLTAQSNPDLLDVAIASDQADNDRFHCSLTPRQLLPLGRFRADVLLSGVTRDGSALPPIPFPVAGTVVPDVRAVPHELTAPIAIAGAPESHCMLVRSASGARFSVGDVRSDSADVTVEPEASPIASTHTFRVSIRFSVPGQLRNRLRFAIANENGDRSELQVPVYGYCMSLDLSNVSPEAPVP
jgi:hypothetical protein